MMSETKGVIRLRCNRTKTNHYQRKVISITVSIDSFFYSTVEQRIEIHRRTKSENDKTSTFDRFNRRLLTNDLCRRKDSWFLLIDRVGHDREKRRLS